MHTRTEAVSEQQGEVLLAAIHRGQRAVLSLLRPDGWRTYRAEFASGSRSSGRIVLRLAPAASEDTAVLPNPGETVGVTFRSGRKKCMFAAKLAPTSTSDDGIVLALNWPDHLQQLQRRLFERVAPPRSVIVPVRFWTPDTGEDDAPGDRRQVRHGQLEDLSAGGMRIKTSDLTDIDLERVYRCALTPRRGGPALIVDARLRHRQAADCGRASLGFQFIGLEATSEGQRTLARLARLVTQYQQARRRHRSR